jgi:hypothetical protein
MCECAAIFGVKINAWIEIANSGECNNRVGYQRIHSSYYPKEHFQRRKANIAYVPQHTLKPYIDFICS